LAERIFVPRNIRVQYLRMWPEVWGGNWEGAYVVLVRVLCDPRLAE
jgi:hypothetical protein